MFYVPEPEYLSKQKFEYGTCVHTRAQYEVRPPILCIRQFGFSGSGFREARGESRARSAGNSPLRAPLQLINFTTKSMPNFQIAIGECEVASARRGTISA